MKGCRGSSETLSAHTAARPAIGCPLLSAPQDCGGTNNTACANDITGIAAALGKASVSVSKATTGCLLAGLPAAHDAWLGWFCLAKASMEQ